MKTLAQLQADFEALKKIADDANGELSACKKLILDNLQVIESLKRQTFGVRNFDRLRVDRKENRIWDQVALLDFVNEERPPIDEFPFDIVFKEKLKDSKALAESKPEVWARLLPFLTKKPANPSVSLTPEKKQ
ncbi:hypothetical protein FLL45_01445 [Aliikangiella marina]|uniref:Uncharacterized protein n=1 Tax=Aliikangiella marina TaxID=1712262 RepID=A0A545THL9_9GAMM|nr:hypothetical protein [Aliikangiella marina]TQV76651.1 hypothetical protein FLL45_01445 [Aliikangiella marina]